MNIKILRTFAFHTLLYFLPKSSESFEMAGTQFLFVAVNKSRKTWVKEQKSVIVEAIKLLDHVQSSDLVVRVFKGVKKAVFIDSHIINKSHYLSGTVLVPVREGYTDNAVYLASLFVYFSCVMKQTDFENNNTCLQAQREFLSKVTGGDVFCKWFDESIAGRGNI